MVKDTYRIFCFNPLTASVHLMFEEPLHFIYCSTTSVATDNLLRNFIINRL